MKRSVLSLILVLGSSSACDSKSESKPAEPQASKIAEPSKPPKPTRSLRARSDDHKPADETPKPVAVGAPAPDFELPDLEGKQHSLADYRGKTVVLEWFNPECPFVNYAHEQGPLKDMAANAKQSGVVWLAINSNAEGKQGHGAEANRTGAEKFGMTHPILLDPSGAIGRRYGAEKTPHIFIIDGEGTLVYRGAVDNAPMGEVDGDGEKRDYVEQALAAITAGKKPEVAETPAYGCSVKYG